MRTCGQCGLKPATTFKVTSRGVKQPRCDTCKTRKRVSFIGKSEKGAVRAFGKERR